MRFLSSVRFTVFPFAASLAFSVIANANILTSTYPYTDPSISTLSVSLLAPAHQPEYIALPSLAGRNDVSLFKERAKLTFGLYANEKTAPLMIIVPGIGGSDMGGSLQVLAENFHKAGFTSVVVANPFSWQFILARSPDAVPGFIPSESRELAKVLDLVLADLKSRGYKPSDVSLLGYSMGALHAAFLEMQDRAETGGHRFGFHRVILVNPPLDMSYAISTLDKLSGLRGELTQEQQDVTWGLAMQRGQAALKQGPSALLQLSSGLGFSKGQRYFLIGDTFSQTLSDAIFTSQQVNDRGLLKIPASEFHRNDREAEARALTFSGYVSRLAAPYWQEKNHTHLSTEDFLAQASLSRRVAKLSADPAIRMVHNEDDFLTQRKDLDAMNHALGDHAAVYEHGGHLGNLWYPETVRKLIEFAK